MFMPMAVDIYKLKENDIKKLGWNETKQVVKLLEKAMINASSLCDNTAIKSFERLDEFEKFYSFLTIINNRVDGDDFKAEVPRNWEKQKSKIKGELFNLLIACQHYRDTYTINSMFEHLRATSEDLRDQYRGIKDNFNTLSEEHDKKIQETIDSFKDNESKTVTHVLTLMGVFSAVITVILSVVVTSSSWLNNANGSSAILAFVVPNLVTLIAVATVVLLILIYNAVFFSQASKNKRRFIASILFATLLISVIVLGMFGMTKLAYKYAETDNRPHLREVINADQYKIIGGISTDKFFEFEYDGKNYQFAYDEQYLHDSKLYFCPTHNTLE